MTACGAIIAAIIQIGTAFYNGWVRQPNIKSAVIDNNTIHFSIKREFRGVTIKLHPQMVIQYDNCVVLSIYLDGYYEEEFLYFNDDNECQAVRQHVNYVEKLQEYLEEEIAKQLCAKKKDLSKEEVRKHLKLHVINLGGVRYESAQGNDEKRYCIIEWDGIVRDLDKDSEEIQNRLYEARLQVKDDLISMENDEEIARIVDGITEPLINYIEEGGI